MSTSPGTVHLPLFPLAAVLYPAGRMQLRIFEHRYLEMVRECARSGSGFGICLILDGDEAGAAALPAAVGTLARIIDFYTAMTACLAWRWRVCSAFASCGPACATMVCCMAR